MQRQSNNFRPQFTDEECITVYLWGISQRRFEQKAIYNYTKNHLSEWFPKLPRYQAFSRRCNTLAPAFRALAERYDRPGLVPGKQSVREDLLLLAKAVISGAVGTAEDNWTACHCRNYTGI